VAGGLATSPLWSPLGVTSHAMDLLERASLLDELRGVLATTAAGGRVVLLAGEAGIGKSALVRRFTERSSADARFLLGPVTRCSHPVPWVRCRTSPG
jgi:ATP/maltotriose-dependent transcriptional regulator MalT